MCGNGCFVRKGWPGAHIGLLYIHRAGVAACGLVAGIEMDVWAVHATTYSRTVASITGGDGTLSQCRSQRVLFFEKEK